MAQVLIIKSLENESIVSEMLQNSMEVFTMEKVSFDEISVPSIFEMPAALGLAMDTNDYEGVLCVGCIKDESKMSEKIYQECIASLNDFAIHFAMPLGMGVGFFGKKDKITKIAPALGKKAAINVLHMMRLKRQFNVLEDERYAFGQQHN